MYANNTLIFVIEDNAVIEDDAQNGLEHVDLKALIG
jgi:hypothetical protein